jgi:hypothetical protein
LKKLEKVDSLIQFPKCHLAATHAEFDEMDFVEWRMLGSNLCRMSGASQWWIGDWLVAGAQRFVPAEPKEAPETSEQKQRRKEAHKRYSRAVEQTGYDLATLKDLVWVSRGIVSSRRRDGISWSHHREVLALESTKEQDKFLKLAAQHKWTRSQLRQAIRAERADKKSVDAYGAPTIDFAPSRWANQFTRWIAVQLKDKPLEDWPNARRMALRRELQPVVDVYNQLESRTTPGKESLKASATNR